MLAQRIRKWEAVHDQKVRKLYWKASWAYTAMGSKLIPACYKFPKTRHPALGRNSVPVQSRFLILKLQGMASSFIPKFTSRMDMYAVYQKQKTNCGWYHTRIKPWWLPTMKTGAKRPLNSFWKWMTMLGVEMLEQELHLRNCLYLSRLLFLYLLAAVKLGL